MLRRLTLKLMGATAVVIVALFAGPCRAAQPQRTDSTPLILLAASRFPDLRKAERAMLRFSDADNIDRSEIAIAATSLVLNRMTNTQPTRIAKLRWSSRPSVAANDGKAGARTTIRLATTNVPRNGRR